MPNLLTFANLGGAGADSGGCWEFVGARLIGTSGDWLAPQTLTVGGVPGSYANGDSVGATDDPLVVFDPDWCGYELAFIYTNDCGGPVTCAVETQFVFDVLESCCDCAVDAVISVLGCVLTVDSDGCVCSGGCSYEWDRSCDGQESWEHLPVFDGDSSIIADDNCCYRVRVTDCDDGCNNTSNVLCVTCYDPCPGSITATVDGCLWKDFVYPCTPAFWAFSYSLNAGASYTQYVSGTNNPLDPFQVPFSALWKLFVVCDNGCQETITQDFASCDPPCDCTGQLTFNQASCSLIVAGFDGVDCGVNQTQGIWEYSGTNSNPWSIVGTEVIAGPGSFTHTPTENGWYRFTIEDPSGLCECTGALIGECVLGPIHVTCVPVCDCNSVSLSISGNCLITPTLSGCCSGSCGYSYNWSYSVDGVTNWQTVFAGLTTINPDNYFGNGFYRLKITHPECPLLQDIIEVTCVPVCSPTVTITQLPDCRLMATWSGCDGVPVTSQWNPAVATSTPGSCAGAFGWGLNIPDDVYIANPDGTGSAIITPTAGETCYRFWISCCSDTGIVEDQFYWTPCCDDNPSIDEDTLATSEVLRFESPINPASNDTQLVPGLSGDKKWRKHAKKRLTVNGNQIEYSDKYSSEFKVYYACRRGDIEHSTHLMDYVEEISIITQSGAITVLDLDPTTTPYLTGVGGTVSVGSLYVQDVGAVAWSVEFKKLIRNALGTVYGASEGINYEFNVDIGSDGFTPIYSQAMIYFTTKRNDAAWLDLYQIKWARVTGGPVEEFSFLIKENTSNGILTISHEGDCGTMEIVEEPRTAFHIWNNGVTIEYYTLSGTTPWPTGNIIPLQIQNDGDTQESQSCNVVTLTVDGECLGATYLWNTSEITESITATVSGTYTVTVTCPDGCIYDLETTIVFP